MPRITWVHLAFVSGANLSTHGEIMSHMPSAKFIHSSHSANAESVAIERMASTTPMIQAFHAGVVSATYPTTHGEMNKQTARTRLIQSCTVRSSVRELAMTTSI